MSAAVVTSPQDEPRWLDDAEMAAWRAFINGSQRLIATLNRELVELHGLSIDDYRILVLLSESPTSSLRMSELADGIVSSRSRLTHQVRRLEADGLVQRRDCPSDGRGVLAALTAGGRARLTAVAPDHVAGVRRHLIDGLSAPEREAVTRVFARVDAELSGA